MNNKTNRKKATRAAQSDLYMTEVVRQCMGHAAYSRGNQPKRRLRCSNCKKTWKFSDPLNCSPCPACKDGRLS